MRRRGWVGERLEPRWVLDSTLVFNEIMYHPRDAGEQLEFVELYNQMGTELDVARWQLAGGIEFTFPEGTFVPAGGHLVVARDPAALQQATGVAALGPYRGALSSGGETLELRDLNQRLMDSIEYDDALPWPLAADGRGPSLAKIDPRTTSSPAEHWTSSRVVGGTPGAANFAEAVGPPPQASLTINEVAAAAAADFFVELANNGSRSIDLDGMSLVSDSGYQYRFPAGSALSAAGLLVLSGRDLSLPRAAGERLHLISADGTWVIDSAEVQSVGQGRSTDGTGVVLVPSMPTPGTANRFELHDEIVINEIMYHHRSETVAAAAGGNEYAVNDEEWIELYNRGVQSVDLSGWRLAEAVDYRFPADTMLEPGKYLLIARDAAALTAKYPQLAGQILGNFSGQLSNGNERLRLLDEVGNPADEVRYYEDGQWPAGADGRGSSLELRDPQADNRVGLAWAASDEADDSPWQTYSYQGVAARSPVGPDGRWQELVLGMLDDGEVLLDDIQVIENPQGAAVDLIQNGSFQEDAIGTAPRAWRIIGNHRHSEVVDDPDTPGNRVLRLVATGGR